MRFLDSILLHNSLRAWLLALAMTLGCLVAFKLLQWLVLNRLAAWSERTETKVDDLIVEVLRSTRPVYPTLAALCLGAKTLHMTPALQRYLNLALFLVLLLQGALWASKAISVFLAGIIAVRKEEDAGSVTALQAWGLVAKFMLWSLILLIALSNLGINVTSLIAGLGVGGIAVALAMQNILGDLFASLSIVLDKPFALGDSITVGEWVGTVEHIGLKTTRVRSLSGEQIIFSNSDLLKSRIRNNKRMLERRIPFTLGVTLQTAPAQLAALPAMIRTAMETQEGIRIDRVHLKEISSDRFVYEMVYYCLDPDYGRFMDIQQGILLAIINRLEAEGIDLAYPTQVLHHRRREGGWPGVARADRPKD